MHATLTVNLQRLHEARAEAANRAMVAAIRGRMGEARSWSRLAQRIDRATGTPFALTAREWDNRLDSWRQVAA